MTAWRSSLEDDGCKVNVNYNLERTNGHVTHHFS